MVEPFRGWTTLDGYGEWRWKTLPVVSASSGASRPKSGPAEPVYHEKESVAAKVLAEQQGCSKRKALEQLRGAKRSRGGKDKEYYAKWQRPREPSSGGGNS